MADVTVSIGGIEDAFIYDDTEFYDDNVTPLVGIRTSRIQALTAPSEAKDVLRFEDLGDSVAPAGAEYLVLALSGILTAERLFTLGGFLSAIDTGAGGSYTLTVEVKDEDNMVSNSAVHLATQQSIKAYVDAQSSGSGSEYWQDPVIDKDLTAPPP